MFESVLNKSNLNFNSLWSIIFFNLNGWTYDIRLSKYIAKSVISAI